MNGRTGLRVLIGSLLFLTAGAVFAQPFGPYLNVGSGHGYIQLPSHPALNFENKSFTFEAWVSAHDDGGCTSLAGSGYQQAQWIGICGTTLRSYMAGTGTAYTIGTVPADNWTHVAVTFDHATRVHSHYVDGELAGQRVDAGPMTANVDAWRIFSDADWQFTPVGSIDEVRIWNVARTQAQIREGINEQLRNSLVAYPMAGSGNDPVGGVNGTLQGTAAFLTTPVSAGCATNANQLCIGPSGRFQVTGTFNTSTETARIAKVVTGLTTPESGLFWFFGADNWEVMVKMLDGCGINNHKWVFASATTDQHFELAITDLHHGETKRYFSYAGPPAPAIIDVEALATCP